MILFTNFSQEYQTIRKEIDEAVRLVFLSGRLILGPEVEKFEKNFAKYCGVKYCVGVNSATDALYLSLLCAGIGRGDEVIVPVNTAVPTAVAVTMSGAKPVFVDCDESYLININQISQVITQRTKAIIPVHLYGQACDMKKLSTLAKQRGLTLIEDCAQANGAVWQGKKVGAWSDFGCFSFYPTKNLGAYGDGGVITTNSKKAYKKLKVLRFYGQTDRDTASHFGVNSRLDEMQAAILSVKLKYLDRWNRRRREIASWYRKFITNPAIVLPESKNAASHVFHLFVIRTKQRDALRRFLKEKGIETLVHYPVALNRQPVFKKLAGATCPKAEQFAGEILSLPMHPFLKDTEVKKIALLINKFNK